MAELEQSRPAPEADVRAPAARQAALGDAPAVGALSGGVLARALSSDASARHRRIVRAHPAAIKTMASMVGNRAIGRMLSRTLIGFNAADFEAGVGDMPVGGGQFMFTAAVREWLDNTLLGLVGPADDPPEVDAMRALMANKRARDFSQRRAAVVQTVKASSLAYAPDLLKLIGPESAGTSAAGSATVARLWDAYKKAGSAPPRLSGLTICDLRGVNGWELSACWTTTERIGAKFADSVKGKATRSPSTMLPETSLFADIRKRTRSERADDIANLTAAPPVPVRGDEVIYDRRLPGIVVKMKAAIADGWTLHVRVISGIYLDMAGAGTPTEEHSLLIYGADGDEFFCFDPDLNSNTGTPRVAAAGASAAAPNSGRAFQSLFFDAAANRLTTAQSDAEFLVDGHGRDQNGVHRYQVVRAFTANHG
jgi:hypothetical protein